MFTTIKREVGFEVDKYELISALQYDRNQYDKGYKDGAKETFKAELEEIKAEIQNPKEIGLDFYDGLAVAERIIDNHIKEIEK